MPYQNLLKGWNIFGHKDARMIQGVIYISECGVYW